MKTKNLLKKLILTLLMVAVTGQMTPVLVAGTAGEDVLLKSIPADCMFCLRINNFNESLGKLDQYLSGALPTPFPMAMMINMQLGAIVGDPMLTGLNMTGDFGVFAIAPSEGQMNPSVGMLIPMNNFKEFVSSNPNCKPTENGLTLLAPPNNPQGGFVLAPAGDTHALVVQTIAQDTMPQLQQALKAEPKLLKRLSPAQSKEAVSAPAWAYVNLSNLYEKYKDLVMGMVQIAQMGSAAQTPPGMEDMMKLYFKMLPQAFNEFAGDADSLTLSLHPEPALLSIDMALRGKDGSDLAQMFVAGNPAPEYSFTGYLDNNNAINGLVKMDASSLLKMYDKMFDIMAASIEDPALKEKTNNMKALTQKAFDAMGDEASFSYSYTGATPPFQLQEVVEIKDQALLKETMTEGMNYANELYKSMGIPAVLKYEPGVSTYKNATIDVVSIVVSGSDDTDNVMQQEMAKMYGDDFKYYMAHTADKLYVTMGPDGETKLKSLIDQPVSAPVPEDMNIAMKTLKNTPHKDWIASVNIIKLVTGLGEMMQTLEGNSPAGAPVPFSLMKDLNVESQSTLVVGGHTADGQAAIRLALPKQHLIEIIALGMQIQQKMMAPQQQSQPIAPSPATIE